MESSGDSLPEIETCKRHLTLCLGSMAGDGQLRLRLCAAGDPIRLIRLQLSLCLAGKYCGQIFSFPGVFAPFLSSCFRCVSLFSSEALSCVWTSFVRRGKLIHHCWKTIFRRRHVLLHYFAGPHHKHTMCYSCCGDIQTSVKLLTPAAIFEFL